MQENFGCKLLNVNVFKKPESEPVFPVFPAKKPVTGTGKKNPSGTAL